MMRSEQESTSQRRLPGLHAAWAGLLSCAMMMFAASGCSLLPVNESPAQTGAIYGQVDIRGRHTPAELAALFESMEIRLNERGEVYGVTDRGIFHLPGLPPGTYHVTAAIPGQTTMRIEDIDVSADSISIVPIDLSWHGHPSAGPWRWPLKIRQVSLDQRGSITGRVTTRYGGTLRASDWEGDSVRVWIRGGLRDWSHRTDRYGYFEITDILPGRYELRGWFSVRRGEDPVYARGEGHYGGLIKDVVVRHNKTAVVHFGMCFFGVIAIPGHRCPEQYWQPQYLENNSGGNDE